MDLLAFTTDLLVVIPSPTALMDTMDLLAFTTDLLVAIVRKDTALMDLLAVTTDLLVVIPSPTDLLLSVVMVLSVVVAVLEEEDVLAMVAEEADGRWTN